MKKLQLLFSNEIILENTDKMKLDYNLTEKTSEDCDGSVYGIQITKYHKENIETEEINNISYSKDVVVSIVHKLYHYEVTPISMVDIVDDLLSEAV